LVRRRICGDEDGQHIEHGPEEAQPHVEGEAQPNMEDELSWRELTITLDDV